MSVNYNNGKTNSNDYHNSYTLKGDVVMISNDESKHRDHNDNEEIEKRKEATTNNMGTPLNAYLLHNMMINGAELHHDNDEEKEEEEESIGSLPDLNTSHNSNGKDHSSPENNNDYNRNCFLRTCNLKMSKNIRSVRQQQTERYNCGSDLTNNEEDDSTKISEKQLLVLESTHKTQMLSPDVKNHLSRNEDGSDSVNSFISTPINDQPIGFVESPAEIIRKIHYDGNLFEGRVFSPYMNIDVETSAPSTIATNTITDESSHDDKCREIDLTFDASSLGDPITPCSQPSNSIINTDQSPMESRMSTNACDGNIMVIATPSSSKHKPTKDNNRRCSTGNVILQKLLRNLNNNNHQRETSLTSNDDTISHYHYHDDCEDNESQHALMIQDSSSSVEQSALSCEVPSNTITTSDVPFSDVDSDVGKQKGRNLASNLHISIVSNDNTVFHSDIRNFNALNQSSLTWHCYSDDEKIEPVKMSFFNNGNVELSITLKIVNIEDCNGDSINDGIDCNDDYFNIKPFEPLIIQPNHYQETLIAFSPKAKNSSVQPLDGKIKRTLVIEINSKENESDANNPSKAVIRSNSIMVSLVAITASVPIVQVNTTRVEWCNGGYSRMIRLRNAGKNPILIETSITTDNVDGNSSNNRFHIVQDDFLQNYKAICKPSDHLNVWVQCSKEYDNDTKHANGMLIFSVTPVLHRMDNRAENDSTSSKTFPPKIYEVKLFVGCKVEEKRDISRQ